MTLPPAVHDLALRLGAESRRGPKAVTLCQSGAMKLSLASAHWWRFTARQTMAVEICAFAWQARFRPCGFLAVTDALERGTGRLEVTAFGVIPLLHTDPSQGLTRGELMRYLAELAFVPDAILHNPQLRWRVEAADRICVSAGSGAEAAEVTLSLGSDGRIAGVYAADRPRSVKPPFLPTPWQGGFSDYRQHQGRWIPGAGQIGWVIDGVETPYWRGICTDWAAQ
jgi:hypothetical protein